MKNKKYKIVSFFSGCGGLDLGITGNFKYKKSKVKKLPFDILAAYDNNEKCIITYHKNIGQQANLLDLSIADPNKMPKADILIGGFPCQDFSSCGPHAGLTSKRGRLYRSIIKYIKTHRPKIILAENVVNLARMKNGEILKTIVEEIEDTGYKVCVWNLYAPDYGVPQTRKRLFIIGVREGISGFPEKPTATHANSPRSIDWAIHDLINIKDETVPNQSQYFKAKNAINGNRQGDEINTVGNPSYTIRANSKSRIQYHYKLKRRLTVRECARLQTFPDDFIFPHSATTNMMQIGNAVPPLLAYHVGRAIMKFLKKRKDK